MERQISVEHFVEQDEAPCSKCGGARDRVGRYCKACHAEYMRQWRVGHPLTDEQRIKDNARSYANTYLRRGKIVRQGCRECGAEAEMHHPDYDKPTEVVWLCRQHHLALHAGVQATIKGMTVEPIVIIEDPPCRHPRSIITILNGGLARCRCGAVRNAAGEWHE